MSDEIKRYSHDLDGFPFEDENGDHVEYSDYALLASQLKAIKDAVNGARCTGKTQPIMPTGTLYFVVVADRWQAILDAVEGNDGDV